MKVCMKPALVFNPTMTRMRNHTLPVLRRKMIVSLGLVLLSVSVWGQQTANLAGKWEFQIDRNGTMKAGDRFDDRIQLPGSMPQRLKGDKPSVETVWTGSLYDSSYFHNPYMRKYQTEDNFKLPFFLTPERHYEGVAWYRRKVKVPREMEGRRIVLFLERPHIISTLYINGQEVGSRNSLSVAHEYDVTDYVKAGEEATIALRIDNDHKKVGVGQDSHSVTDQTQGNWNGIAGRMELRSTPLVFADRVDVFPDVVRNTARVEVTVVRHRGSHVQEVELTCGVRDAKDNGSDMARTKVVPLEGDTTVVSMDYRMPDGTQLWDEFSPTLYQMLVSVRGKGAAEKGHELSTTFGMRSIEARGKDILVNGRLTMLRGTVENCCFPMTGYAPTTKEEWMRVFRKCKEYGLNHMRFHSFCPPEAAFEAADEVGFYLQPEGPSWPNHGIKLGNGMMIDTYLMEETQRMVKAYGNHPSFAMMACGNEPAGGWVRWVSNFVDYWKKTDPRRIYTGASVGGSWAWQPRNEYHVKAGARGLDSWKNHAPESTENYLAKIDTVSQPFVSHETGQWCVFPDFDEIRQYKGAVNKGRNLEIFRDILEDQGMSKMGRKFLMASGKTQVMCYKAEIERTLRTPHYAGFQLLALNDYSGQGSALVGPLNVFWREKGYVDSEEWREFCSPVTLLAELPKFVYWDDEDIQVTVKLSNYGQADLEDVWLELTADFGDGEPRLFKARRVNAPLGLTELMSGVFAVEGVDVAKKVRLTATLKTGEEKLIARNHWDIHVFPRRMPELEADRDIYIAKSGMHDEVLSRLRAGKKVLLLAGGRWSPAFSGDTGHLSYGEGIVQQFTPVFWNTSWFKMKPPHTTGMYINQEHPIFRYFPTEDWADMQWYSLMNRQPVMLMDNFPKDLMPIVQPIDTWFLSRKLGMLFEAEVEGGKLMVSTMPYDNQNDPAQAYMIRAILQYMSSEEFRPTQKVELGVIRQLFTDKTPDVNLFTNENPDELRPGGAPVQK